MVRTFFIYGHESWYITVTSDKKFVVFENKALQRFLAVKWWHRGSNDRVREITCMQPVDEYVRLSR